MIETTTSAKGWTVGRAGLAGLVVSVAVVAVAALLTQGPSQAGGVTGAVAGTIGGFVGLVLVGRAKGTSPKPLLAALVGAFLVRLLLVAAGLVVTLKALAGDPLAFVFAFFPLFMTFVLLEGLVAGAQVKAAQPRQELEAQKG